MGSMTTCPCGWTLMSPLGDEDVKKHTLIHLRDAHPGTSVTDEEMKQKIKTI